MPPIWFNADMTWLGVSKNFIKQFLNWVVSLAESVFEECLVAMVFSLQVVIIWSISCMLNSCAALSILIKVIYYPHAHSLIILMDPPQYSSNGSSCQFTDEAHLDYRRNCCGDRPLTACRIGLSVSSIMAALAVSITCYLIYFTR